MRSCIIVYLSALVLCLGSRLCGEIWLEGTVLDVDRSETPSVVLAHRGAEGLPAGKTRFICDPATEKFVHSGQQIRGRADKLGEIWRIAQVWPADHKSWKIYTSVSSRMKENPPASLIREGSLLPLFAACDRTGAVVVSEDWLGQTVALFLFDSRSYPAHEQESLSKLMQEVREFTDFHWIGLDLFPEIDAPAQLGPLEDALEAKTGCEVDLYLARPLDADLLRRLFSVSAIATADIPPVYTPALFYFDLEGRLRERFEGQDWPQSRARSILTGATYLMPLRNR